MIIIGKVLITLLGSLAAMFFGGIGLDLVCKKQPSGMPGWFDVTGGLTVVTLAICLLLAAISVWFCPETAV